MILRTCLTTRLLLSVAVVGLFQTACPACQEPPTDGGVNDGGDPPDAALPDAGEPDAGEVDAGANVLRPPNPLNDAQNDEFDSDCDGLSDADEFGTVWPGGGRTDPANPDSDGDGILDGVEAGNNRSIDDACEETPKDEDRGTTTNPTIEDSDGDCIPDGLEDKNGNGRFDADEGETDAASQDSDEDGLLDGEEDENCNGRQNGAETNAGNGDSDGDGVEDGVEIDLGLNPLDEDSDGDGVSDGDELRDGTNPVAQDADSDGDGIADVFEQQNGTDAQNPDSDGDGLCDGAQDIIGVCEGGEDVNGNGLIDNNETNPRSVDTDCDGLEDGLENTLGLSPNDVDSDGDGLRDGIESGIRTAADASCGARFVADADPATTTDPLRRDTDGDGIPDGAEDRNHDGALANANVSPRETDPTKADTDADGVCDGFRTVANVCRSGEDLNGDGLVTAGETDPRVAQFDRDNDGLLADAEQRLGTSDQNADSDGDGINDGAEDLNRNGVRDANETNPASADSDCDGLADGAEAALGANPLLRDSDGDLIPDGVEAAAGPVANVVGCGQIVVDVDRASSTNPANRDTDGDGLADGIEDRNQNGRRDNGETDPNNPDTDNDGLCDGPNSLANRCTAGEDLNGNGRADADETSALVSDADDDNDGLPTSREADLGTNPNNADSDGDGINDGREVNDLRTDPLSLDSDCDGLPDGQEIQNNTDPQRADSDNDGITDGVERGTQCRVGQDTAASCIGRCIVDADPTTTTDPRRVDSDNDGVADGAEDANQNGSADEGELDPQNGNDTEAADRNACAANNLRDVVLIERASDRADLTLAIPADEANITVTTLRTGSDERGAMVFLPARQQAIFAFKISPALGGAGVADKLGTLEGILSGAGQLRDKFTQTVTTWDGNQAVLAQFIYNDNNNDVVGKSANDLVQQALLGVTGALPNNAFGTDRGPFLLKLEVIDRSAQSTIVVGAIGNAANIQNNEQRFFRIVDITNGTALAQAGDVVSTQCDRLNVEAEQKVDFVWIVDNSGSMGNEQQAVAIAAQQMVAQLSATTADARLAVMSSDVDVLPNDLAAWQSCDFPSPSCVVPPANKVRYCPFTRDSAAFQACMTSLGTAGNGSEAFFKPLACMLGRSVDGKDQCGREGVNISSTRTNDRGPYLDGYGPAPISLLPRSVVEDANKIRDGADVVFIFLTDTNEQSDCEYRACVQDEDCPVRSLCATEGVCVSVDNDGCDADPNTNLDLWQEVFNNFDGLGNAQSRAFVAGIVCPVGANCSDYNDILYMNNRWRTFFSNVNGVEAQIPSDDDPDRVAKLQEAVSRILDLSVAQASPYVLQKPPVSSTIKVAMDAETQGPCNTADIPRSRVHGFDYDAATNSIVFFGNCRPKNEDVGERISVSYRYWTDESQNPDGEPPQCLGCESPFVCVDGQCLCPSDCGIEGGLPAGQTCDAATCTPECLPDCGGCAGGQVCDVDSCSCSCPGGTCLGDSPGADFVCNEETCLWQCGGCNPAEQPSPFSTCNLDTCEWECGDGCDGNPVTGQFCDTNPAVCDFVCEPDCGGCGGGLVCDVAACACVCPNDCGGVAPGENFVCDQASCQFVCAAVPDENTRPGPNFVFDQNVCDWVCPDDCGQGSPVIAPFQCDARTCEPSCAPGCGGACGAFESCNEDACACECTQTADCAPGFVFDEASCSCTCDLTQECGPTRTVDPETCSCVCKTDDNGNANCGGCAPGQVCRRSLCECATIGG